MQAREEYWILITTNQCTLCYSEGTNRFYMYIKYRYIFDLIKYNDMCGHYI
jgi:hypothetical protein